MSDHSTGKFLARALQATAKQARELDLPEVNTQPGTRLDWTTEGSGPPGPTEYRLTRAEQKQHELARAVDEVKTEVRSMRADQLRMRDVMVRASALNQQVAEALAALAEDKAGEREEVEKLRRWRARVVGVVVGGMGVLSGAAWLIERLVK
jgi:small-conductance mechanosensitive channel